MRTGLRYEFVGNPVAAEEDAQENTLQGRQHAVKKTVLVASLCIAAFVSSGMWLGPFYGAAKPAGPVAAMESNAALSAQPVALTHGVVRGAGGDKWAVQPLTRELHGSTSSVTAGDAACAGAFSDADWHPSHFGVLHVHAAHPLGGNVGVDGAAAPGRGYTALERAEACGVLEGYFTHARLLQTATNLACEVACDGAVPPEVAQFLAAQDAWTDAMVAKAAAAAKKKQAEGNAAGLANERDAEASEVAEEESSKSDDVEAALWVAVRSRRRRTRRL